MVLIAVEFLSTPSRNPEIHRLSRVPNEGESLMTAEESFQVREVIHDLDVSDGSPVAIVRVKNR